MLAIGGLFSSRRDVSDIRSGIGLSDCKADSFLAAEDLGNDLLLKELRGILLERGGTDSLKRKLDSA